MPDEWVGHDFESQRRKWLAVGGAAQLGLVVIRVGALDRRHVYRRRQIINYRVEQWLNALVLECGTGQYRHNLQGECRLANRLAHFFQRQRFAIQIFVDQLIVVFGDIFDHLVAVLFVKFLVNGCALQRCGHVRAGIYESLVPKFFDFKDLKLRAESFLQPNHDFLLEEIDDANEIVFAAQRELQRYRAGAEALLDGADDVIEIRAHAIHLVHKADARHAVLVSLAPHSFRLRLHAGNGVEHANRAVQHAQRALDFHGEVHVTRSIDNVHAIFLAEAIPRSSGRCAGDGDPALALLLHPIHGGGAFIHGTDLVGHTGIEQDALGRRGFSRVDVRHDPDVAGILEFKHPSRGTCCFLLARPICYCLCHDVPYFLPALIFTNDSAQKPCWLQPCGAHLPSSSLRRRARLPRRSIHPPAGRPWSCRHVHANIAKASEWPTTACGTDSLPLELDSLRRPRGASSLPAAASRSRRPS